MSTKFMKENKKIKIVQVIPPQLMKTGDYHYRAESPGKALSKLDDVKSVVNITTIHKNRDLLIRDADLLILHHVFDPDLIPIIIDRRNRALPTVFEVWANVNDIPSQNPLYQFLQDKDIRSIFYRLISMCDLLQFNNSGLLNLFEHLNKNNIIIPDQMSDYSAKETDKQPDGLIIGWTGTMEDLDDLQTIAPELIRWLKSHLDVKLALMAPEDAFRLFDSISSRQKQFFTPGTMKEYYDFLKHIHIGLSPLNEAPYNRCKSDRRFLEFGAFGVVPVLQDSAPYQSAEAPGGTKYLFKYPEQLSNVLDQLVSRDEFRKSIAKKAFGYVRSYRMEEGHAAQRLACYLKLFQKDNKSHPVNEADKLRKIADDMRPGKKTKQSGRRLYLIMPRGNNYGWGVCGKYLARELSRLSGLMYVTEAFSVKDVGDELDYRLLKSLIASDRDIDELLNPKSSNSNSLAVIQAIQGKNLKPWGPKLSIKKKIGYTFFEENILSHKDIEEAKDYFSLVVAGSTWCEDILRKYGLTNTKTIIQGIDPSLFNPHHNQKEYFKDSFVIFSGGKFELRKGQDLVIKAYRHFLERHEDAILIISWNNIWKSTRKSMALSKHIDFIESNEDDGILFKKLMKINGIPLSKVIILPPKPNIAMSRIYKNTDIGLFPNRCEGGTNLVLMEYMACGKPAIASFSSGHKDIVNDENSLILRNMGNIEIKQDQNVTAVWDDPDPDEIIEKLEYAYSNSSRLAGIGRTAGEELSCLTWQKTAVRFHQAVVEI